MIGVNMQASKKIVIKNIINYSIKQVHTYFWSVAWIYFVRFSFFLTMVWCVSLLLMGVFYCIPLSMVAGAVITISYVLLVTVLHSSMAVGIKRAVLGIDRYHVSPKKEQWEIIAKGTFSYMVALTLYVLMVFIGMVFFIIPGCILYARCILFPYYLIDCRVSAIDSLRLSYRSTAGNTLQLFGIALASIIPSLLGYIVHIIVALGFVAETSYVFTMIIGALFIVILLMMYCAAVVFNDFILLRTYGVVRENIGTIDKKLSDTEGTIDSRFEYND